MSQILILAIIWTGANALKPLHMDDTFYYAHAAHLARDPLHPYAFDIFWRNFPEPAIDEVCPPVLPYWWAGCLRLFGPRPVLWKLGLFPLVLLFVLSLERLLNRFSPLLKMPLLWMTVLSPAFLPSLNLMPDVPALALGLGAIALLLRAADRGSHRDAVIAGVLTALAMQTKYSTFGLPVVFLAAGWSERRWDLGALAATVALAGFVAWEVLLFFSKTGSHFAMLLLLKDVLRYPPSTNLGLALLMCVGGVGAAAGLLGATVLGSPRWLLACAGTFVILTYVLQGFIGWGRITYTVIGVAVWSMTAIVACCAMRMEKSFSDKEPRKSRTGWFLVAWLLIELTVYFVLSPFPAVRRILAILVALILLAGYVGERRGRSDLLPLIRSIALGNVVLGIFFASLDFWEALVREQAARWAARMVQPRDPSERAWFAGHWGFQFYAERAGLEMLVPGASRLKQGDWAVIPEAGIDWQQVGLPQNAITLVGRFVEHDAIPFDMRGFYGKAMPLEHRTGPRVMLSLFRLRTDCTATCLFPPAKLVHWAALRDPFIPSAAGPAVLEAIEKLPEVHPLPSDAESWLRRLSESRSHEWSQAARNALRRIGKTEPRW